MTIPEQISNLQALEVFWINDNEFKTFPDAIMSLSTLKWLKFNGNPLSTVSRGAEQWIEAVFERSKQELRDRLNNASLMLPDHEIEALADLEREIGDRIPLLDEFYYLDDIGSQHSHDFGFSIESGRVICLEITQKKMLVLPESIGNLNALTVLFLSGNSLSSLPDTLGDLAKLKELAIIRNNVVEFPQAICNIIMLEKLFFGNCGLTSVPEKIGNLKHLQELSIVSNRLEQLPESIGNLTNLKKLALDSNQLSSLPLSIGSLSSLEELNISGNKLISLPETIGNLINLKKLVMKDNRIINFPETLENLTSLRELSLSYTRIRDIGLVDLGLSFNSIPFPKHVKRWLFAIKEKGGAYVIW